MGKENRLYSISLGVASLQSGLVGVATALSPAMCRPFQVFSPSFFCRIRVNYMREHVPQDVRIHYVITNGGAAPNIVPEFAESYYYVRHPDPGVVAEVFERVKKAAEGAALGTGTTFDYEIINGVYSVL